MTPLASRRSRAGLGCALVAAVLTIGGLAACSSADQTPTRTSTVASSSATSSSPTTSSGSSASETAAVRTLAITVTGNDVEPAPARVELARGAVLRLVVTTDRDDELHAHGFDVERKLEAGVPATVDLTGAEPGLYEVETHHPELRLLQVLVR